MNRRLFPLLLFVIVFSVFLNADVLAAERDGINILYVNQNASIGNNSKGESFFVFSDISLKKHEGNVFVFFGSLRAEEFSGNIYAFFSEIKLNSEVNGSVRMFSSSCVTIHENEEKILPSTDLLSVFGKRSVTDEYITLDYTIPFAILCIAMILIKMIAFTVIYFVKRSFFEQGSVTILHKPFAVFRYGVASYFIMLVLIIVFTLSVVGIIFSVLFAAAFYILVLLGEISLAILIGYLMFKKTYIGKITFVNMLIGVVVIELLKQIPTIGYFISLLIVPTLALGIFISCAINGYIYKEFFVIDR